MRRADSEYGDDDSGSVAPAGLPVLGEVVVLVQPAPFAGDTSKPADVALRFTFVPVSGREANDWVADVRMWLDADGPAAVDDLDAFSVTIEARRGVAATLGPCGMVPQVAFRWSP